MGKVVALVALVVGLGACAPNPSAPFPVKAPVTRTIHLGEPAAFVDSRPEWIHARRGQVIAYLTVPELHIRRYPIRFGISLDVLAQGPGLYPGSPPPGSGNFAMAGHRITPVGPWRTCSNGQWGTTDCHGPFRYVDTLQGGDTATVEYRDTSYHYEFVRNLIVRPTDTSILKASRADMTFTACNPPGLATSRIVSQWRLIP